MSCQHSHLTHPHTIATFATLLLFFAPQSWAAPHSGPVKRSSSSGTTIAAPIIAVLVFLIAVPMVFYRKSLFSKLPPFHFPSFRMRRRQQRPSPTTVRNLTADEIAGTAATNQAATTTRTTRRTGRNTRRTPSQISTRSLPVYMKEPGEEELVIIQGSQDMEDAPLTAQVIMPSLREDEDESTNSHSRGPSQASYVNLNDDPLAQTPLLEPNLSNESNHERHVPAGSVDISDFRHDDQSAPLPNDPEVADPRGEAPPYFEVVVNPWDDRTTSEDLARVDTTDTLPIAPDVLPVSSAASRPARRRSMFRGLIDAASRALSSPHPHPGSQHLPLSRPSRDLAGSSSPRPSNLSYRQVGTGSPLTGHRATPSTSGSVQSVTSSAFGRTVSRTQSRSVTNVAAGLTSPSVLSITSISHPLTHTAVRTDFVYPRSGPTPEQLKLISSVESVSKFGVPYGPDAVAYASASLVNLHGPPPEFMERPSTDGLSGPSAGETRARASSALSRVSRDGNTRESRTSMSSLPSSLRESTVAEPAAHDPESTSSHPDREARSPALDHNNSDASPPRPEPSEDKKEQEVDTPVETVPPRAPSPSPTVVTTSTAVTVTRASAAELGVVPESPATSGGHRPALPPLFVAEAARKPIAPSSFRMPPSTPQGRSLASRSSSIETFRTAEERGASDTELETDTFADAESGAETEGEMSPALPHADLHRENTVLGHERPAVSV